MEEYHALLAQGILHEHDRVELLKGEIHALCPVNVRHAHCVRRLNWLFNSCFGARVIVDIQNPIRLDAYSEPQPDVTLLRPRADFYATEHPQPEDILLVVEVADSSLIYDREVKHQLYAAAGIAEFWVVNLVEGRLEVYREPTAQGYRHRQWLWEGDTITLAAFPDIPCKLEHLWSADA